MDRRELLEKVRAAGSLPDEAAAVGAAREVVCALRERLSPEESAHLDEALRGDLPELLACRNLEHAHRRPEKAREALTEPELAERVRDGAGLADLAAARKVIRAVLALVSDRLGEEAPEAPAKPPPANEAQRVGGLGEKRRREGGGGGESEEE